MDIIREQENRIKVHSYLGAQRKALEKELKNIDRKNKEIGSTDYLNIAADLIEKEYGQPCKIVRGRTLYVFKKGSTKKQVRYERQECIVGYIRMLGGTRIELNRDPDVYIEELPRSTEELYEIAINYEKVFKYAQSQPHCTYVPLYELQCYIKNREGKE